MSRCRIRLRIPSHVGKYVALALLFFYVFDFFYSFRLELREKNCEDNREIIGRMKIN